MYKYNIWTKYIENFFPLLLGGGPFPKKNITFNRWNNISHSVLVITGDSGILQKKKLSDIFWPCKNEHNHGTINTTPKRKNKGLLRAHQPVVSLAKALLKPSFDGGS